MATSLSKRRPKMEGDAHCTGYHENLWKEEFSLQLYQKWKDKGKMNKEGKTIPDGCAFIAKK